ncbi:MAG: peptidase M20 [Dethiosulfovibrio peptidovorans]|nr:MAG: peptidase M20 [Dethiosulfovibrio peptidovorans]
MREGVAGTMEEMIRIRRELHRHPEAGWTEFWTTAYVAGALEAMGYDVAVGRSVVDENSIMGRPEDLEPFIQRAVSQGADPRWLREMDGYTGAVAIVETGRPGPTVALRFDIDSVETTEADGGAHLPFQKGFASQNPGCMHACGHDGHTAIGLALARFLMEEKNRLRGRIKLLFQPAEEGVRGGYAMTARGLLDDVDFFVAAHLGLGFPTGTIVAGTRGFLCTTKFDVTYRGQGAHAGAEPHKGKNALLAAATAAVNLHGIAPHKDGLSRVNVGVLQAGEGRNVVPSRASMKVETRGETNDIAQYVYGRAETIVRSAAEMYDVGWHVTKMGEAITASSDPEAVEVVVRAAQDAEGVMHVLAEALMSGSDDATWMMDRVQRRGGVATYVIVGADCSAGHHNEAFDFDERAMGIGLDVLAGVVSDVAKID